MDYPNRTSSDESLNVLQITDTHLYATTDGTLLGLNTQQSLEQCLDLARKQHWPTDLILITGDLVHDVSEQGYKRLHKLLSSMKAPVLVLPGNHDDPAKINAIFTGDTCTAEKHRLVGNWQFILLNSNKPGSESGLLSDTELAHLKTCLEQYPEHHALIGLHHPPMEVGCEWLDPMRLENNELFINTLKDYPNVRSVICGHVHQEYEIKSHGFRIFSSPSTCIQFKPESKEFALDNKTPGFRWLKLYKDGKFDTGITRLDTMPAGLDLASHGY
ncbi:MAG: 3',5'-cyclic-AMP phosphodiesterase [Gammaproteobacteria bacterium]|nr:3',5'-cyclic-AMP phosphodiesterase [Gammaproteobacteria bacterium]MCK5092806.1 3',5'-cyclic-AMP phosphodiesterase [Gammaproteobacteria bacterium]